MKRWEQGHRALSKLDVRFQRIRLNLCLNDLIFRLVTKLKWNKGGSQVDMLRMAAMQPHLVDKQTWSKGNSTATVTTRLFYNSEEQEEELGTTPPDRDNMPPRGII